jgi:hypothetical protein
MDNDCTLVACPLDTFVVVVAFVSSERGGELVSPPCVPEENGLSLHGNEGRFPVAPVTPLMQPVGVSELQI